MNFGSEDKFRLKVNGTYLLARKSEKEEFSIHYATTVDKDVVLTPSKFIGDKVFVLGWDTNNVKWKTPPVGMLNYRTGCVLLDRLPGQMYQIGLTKNNSSALDMTKTSNNRSQCLDILVSKEYHDQILLNKYDDFKTNFNRLIESGGVYSLNRWLALRLNNFGLVCLSIRNTTVGWKDTKSEKFNWIEGFNPKILIPMMRKDMDDITKEFSYHV